MTGAEFFYFDLSVSWVFNLDQWMAGEYRRVRFIIQKAVLAGTWYQLIDNREEELCNNFRIVRRSWNDLLSFKLNRRMSIVNVTISLLVQLSQRTTLSTALLCFLKYLLTSTSCGIFRATHGS